MQAARDPIDVCAASHRPRPTSCRPSTVSSVLPRTGAEAGHGRDRTGRGVTRTESSCGSVQKTRRHPRSNRRAREAKKALGVISFPQRWRPSSGLRLRCTKYVVGTDPAAAHEDLNTRDNLEVGFVSASMTSCRTSGRASSVAAGMRRRQARGFVGFMSGALRDGGISAVCRELFDELNDRQARFGIRELGKKVDRRALPSPTGRELPQISGGDLARSSQPRSLITGQKRVQL